MSYPFAQWQQTNAIRSPHDALLVKLETEHKVVIIERVLGPARGDVPHADTLNVCEKEWRQRRTSFILERVPYLHHPRG